MSGAKHAFAIRVLEDLRRGYLAIAQALSYGPGARSRYRDNAAALAFSIRALKADQAPTDGEISLKVAELVAARERETGRPWRFDAYPAIGCSSCPERVDLSSRGLGPAVLYLVDHRMARHAGEDPLAFGALPS